MLSHVACFILGFLVAELIWLFFPGALFRFFESIENAIEKIRG